MPNRILIVEDAPPPGVERLEHPLMLQTGHGSVTVSSGDEAKKNLIQAKSIDPFVMVVINKDDRAAADWIFANIQQTDKSIPVLLVDSGFDRSTLGKKVQEALKPPEQPDRTRLMDVRLTSGAVSRPVRDVS